MKYEPADVGQPFTPKMSGLQVVLQIHYNNPERLSETIILFSDSALDLLMYNVFYIA